ncbi:MAG: squalene/phytoene synthase family protein [bacterium]|jgi:phytoene synthase|nr:squalene/phytoene synthase family protein [bacterium]
MTSAPASELPPARLRQAHAFCTLFAKVNARHFYYAFRFMRKEQRRAIHAVYAFCQKADQLMDLEPDAAEKRLRLAERRAELDWLEGLLAGSRRDLPTDPILLALLDSLQRRPLPLDLFRSLLDGLEMDLERRSYANMDELENYCWHVASTVGRMVIGILGSREPQARLFADRLGLAMQLTNIARDVREDARDGRVYLPEDLLSRHGLRREDILAERDGQAVRDLLRELCVAAEARYEEAMSHLPRNERNLLKPALVMAGLYRPILGELARRAYNPFLGKVGYPIWRKMVIAIKIILS